ncbi:MAG: HD domain-containing protein [Clostridia bacterium]|nr:HD domain-containing protein [Clostridia bacterium]
MTERIQQLFHRMIEFDRGDPDLIQHFTKVYSYAGLIARSEGLDAHMTEVLEAAALVHDIGIPLCNRKYGSHPGDLQELEGPPLARELLRDLPFDEAETERICRLVGEHHTLTPVDGPDHQILLEADFIVNSFENSYSEEKIRSVFRSVFRTAAGRKIYSTMFGFSGGDETD